MLRQGPHTLIAMDVQNMLWCLYLYRSMWITVWWHQTKLTLWHISFFNLVFFLRISATWEGREGGWGGGVGAQFRVIIWDDNFYHSLDFPFCLLNIDIVCLSLPLDACKLIHIYFSNVWFQKIPIPPPWKITESSRRVWGLEVQISKGCGGWEE